MIRNHIKKIMDTNVIIWLLVIGVFFFLHAVALQRIIPYLIPICFSLATTIILQFSTTPLLEVSPIFLGLGILFGAILFVLSCLLARNNLKELLIVFKTSNYYKKIDFLPFIINIIWEELFWRFCLMSLIENNLILFLFTSFAFAAAHSRKIKTLSEFTDLFCAAILLSILFLSTGSIWAVIIAHFLRNFLVAQVNNVVLYEEVKNAQTKKL